MTTPNLALPEVSASQNQKEVTINDTFNRLDGLLTDTLDTVVTAGGTFVIATADFQTTAPKNRFTFSGTPAAGFTVQVPSVRRSALFRNSTLKIMTLRQAAAGTPTVTLFPGEEALVWFSGTTGGNAARRVGTLDVGFRLFFPGVVANSALLYQAVVERPFQLEDDFLNSQGFCVTAPGAGSAVFTVEKNAVAIGTATFAAAATTATFTTTASAIETFAIGDRLSIRSAAAMNAIADVSLSLFAYRSS